MGPIDHIGSCDWHGGNWKGGGGTTDWLRRERLPKSPLDSVPAGFSRSPFSPQNPFSVAAGVSSQRTSTVEPMQFDTLGNVNRFVSRRGGAIQTQWRGGDDAPRATTAYTASAASVGSGSLAMSDSAPLFSARPPPEAEPSRTGRRMSPTIHHHLRRETGSPFPTAGSLYHQRAEGRYELSRTSALARDTSPAPPLQ